MHNTFNPEQSKDGDDEMRRLHVECGEPVRVSAVLCGSEGGTGSDVEKSEHMLTPLMKLQQFHLRRDEKKSGIFMWLVSMSGYNLM